MRQVTTLVQVLVSCMIMLNGLLLIMTRQEYWPSILLILLPILQCYVVDRRQWYQLPAWASNMIGFGIGAYAVYYFLNNTPERHLAIISDLVSYLIITLLFQSKSPRLYWQISILSVLQAVVASVFSLNLQQGILFLAYICVVITALSVIVYNRDQLMAAGRLDEMQNLTRPGQGLRILRADGSLRTLSNRQNLSRRSFQQLVISITLLALLSVGSGMAVYVSMPTSDQQQGMGTMKLKRTGVNWQISSLEPGGILAKDGAEALRLRILDPMSDIPKRLAGDVYLRGSVLEKMDQEVTGWEPAFYPGRRYPLINNRQYTGKVYSQEIILNPSEDPMLFLVPPALPVEDMPDEVVYDIYTETLFRNPDGGIVPSTPFRYSAGLYALRNDSVPETTPYLNYQNFNYDEPMSSDYEDRYRRLIEVDKEKFPTLVAKADEIAKGIRGKNREAIARALSDYLAFSGRFSYTTDFRDIVRDPELDPVEDFFANFRRGHCELYASALAIMCRSQNIPTRLVVGYRVNRYNEVAGHYQVLRRHAHSWVEVYLRPLDCTRRMESNGEASRGGAWLRLDPTPPASIVDELDTSFMAQVSDGLGYAQSLWDDYVLGMKPQEKKDANVSWLQTLYRLQNIFDLTAMGENLQSSLQSLGAWQRAGIAGLLGLAVAWWNFAARKRKQRKKRYYHSRPPSSGWRQWLPFGNTAPDQRLDVSQWADDLWDRFEKTLVDFGFERRKLNQTPKEYIGSLLKQQELEAQPQLPDQFRDFGDRFYRLRYGAAAESQQRTETEALISGIRNGLAGWKKQRQATNTSSKS